MGVCVAFNTSQLDLDRPCSRSYRPSSTRQFERQVPRRAPSETRAAHTRLLPRRSCCAAFADVVARSAARYVISPVKNRTMHVAMTASESADTNQGRYADTPHSYPGGLANQSGGAGLGAGLLPRRCGFYNTLYYKSGKWAELTANIPANKPLPGS